MQTNFTNWYKETFTKLSNYGLWLRGGEINTLPPEDYEKSEFKVLFARLSSYEDVSYSFTHSFLYQIASSIKGVFPDLSYLPPKQDRLVFEQDNIPWLLGTQTKNGPYGFNVIGISNSIIQETINIPVIFEKSNIPLKKSERMLNPDVPLIILGGANAVNTSFFWDEEPWVDGIFVGHDPEMVKEILTVCKHGYSKKNSKTKILEELCQISGFFEPGKENVIKFKIQHSKFKIQHFSKGIVPYNSEVVGQGHVQISEGCKAWCSFCSESYLRKPYREASCKEVVKTSLELKANMGLDQINLSSFNFNMHSDFYKIVDELVNYFKNIGLKSQRFDMFAKDPAMLSLQTAIGKNSFSCGMEGISSRVRLYLNKNLLEEDLIKSLELLLKAQVRELKIFLLVTGIEEEEDLLEFENFLFEFNELRQKFHSGIRIIFSITPLVRFPLTPLEFSSAYPKEVYEKLIAKMRLLINKFHFEYREAMSTREYVVSQILCRCSEPTKVKTALEKTIKQTNFVYDISVWVEFYDIFMERLAQEGVNVLDLFKGYDFEQGKNKPWALIEPCIRRKALWEMYKKNSLFQENYQDFYVKAEKIQAPNYYREKLIEQKQDEQKFAFHVELNDNSKGLIAKYIGTALASAMMKSCDELTPYFRSFGSLSDVEKEDHRVWIMGDAVITLVWDKNVAPVLEKKLKDLDFLKKVNNEFARWGILKGGFAKEAEDKQFVVEGDYDCDVNAYCKVRGLTYTLRKKEEGVYFLDFSKDALKKKILSACTYSKKQQGGYKVSLSALEKFQVIDFVKEAFKFQDKNDWVKVKMKNFYDIIKY